jgi:hypothetical protein
MDVACAALRTLSQIVDGFSILAIVRGILLAFLNGQLNQEASCD